MVWGFSHTTSAVKPQSNPGPNFTEPTIMKNLNTQKGFTLIELMIVVAIIAILAAIAIPQYQNYVARSQISKAVAEAGALKTAYEDCLARGDDPADATSCVNIKSNVDPSFGKITVKVTAADTGAGTIEEEITGGTPKANGTITWTRDANGVWTCAATQAASLAPKSCPGV